MRVLRGQKEQNISVKLGTFPSGQRAGQGRAGRPTREEPKTHGAGSARPDLAPGTGPNKDGVLITDVDGASDAAQKGLKSGDVILEVGNVTGEDARGSRQRPSRRSPSSGARPC